MTVISMAELLFWLTQVPPVYSGSMGADIRTVVLAWGISIFKPCHRKVCFQAGKKVKFVPAQWLRKDIISKCWAPEHFCCRCV